jgi:hypothetical protein
MLLAGLWYDFLINNERDAQQSIATTKHGELLQAKLNETFVNLSKDIKEDFTAFVSRPENFNFALNAYISNCIVDKDLGKSFAKFLGMTLETEAKFYNMHVRLDFYDFNVDSNKYKLLLTQEWEQKSSKKQFIVIVASDNYAINHLTSPTIQCDYLCCISDIDDFDIGGIEEHIRLQCYEQYHQNSVPVKYRRRALDRQERKALFKDISGLDEYLDRIIVIENVFEPHGNDIFLRLEVEHIISTQDEYSFWTTDGLTYLKKIELRYKELTHHCEEFAVHHFFSNTLKRFHDDKKNGIKSMDYEGWVFRGQGVMLNWRVKR